MNTPQEEEIFTIIKQITSPHKLLQLAKTNLALLLNAGSLVGSTAVTSILGFAYWWVATRLYTPNAIGLASALISAMTLLATISMLGLGTLLTGELPRQPGKEWALINAVLIVVGSAGMVAGVIFALVAPFISPEFDSLWTNIPSSILFAFGVSFTALTMVLDQALIGILRGDLQFWRNTLFAASKLVTLFVMGLFLPPGAGIIIYATWFIGNAFSLVILFFAQKPRARAQETREKVSLSGPLTGIEKNIPLLCPDCNALSPNSAFFCSSCGFPLTPTMKTASVRINQPYQAPEFADTLPLSTKSAKSNYLPQWGLLRKLGGAAIQHHILNLILLAPPLVLPILVTVQLSVTENAWFYVSFMLANFVFSLTYALSTVLYAISSAQPSVLAQKIRFTLGLSFITSLGANIVLQFGAGLLLGIFGHAYAEQAAWCLRILSMAVFPLIIISHYITICRIQNKITYVILPITVGTIIELAGAAIGAHLNGLVGLSLGWLTGLVLESLYMVRAVYQAAYPVKVHPMSKEIQRHEL